MLNWLKKDNTNLSEETLNFIEKCVSDLNTRNNKLDEQWQISTFKNYDIDLDNGIIEFRGDKEVLGADIQVIGTFHNGSFLWGWDHPSVPKRLRHDASLVRKWGIEKDINIFTQRKTPCDESMAWSFMAIAATLSNADGGYRAKTGDTLVFLTISNLRIIDH